MNNITKVLKEHLESLPASSLHETYRKYCSGRRDLINRKLYKDVLQYCFGFLDFLIDMRVVRQVCRRWREYGTNVRNCLTMKVPLDIL